MNLPTAPADARRPIDLLLDAAWIIPIVPAGVCLENHSLAIHEGQIADLLPSADALMRYAPREHRRLPQHVLLPGLVNAHTHAAMTLLRGYADDLPLESWLRDHIWPAEGRHAGPDFVATGSRLACMEMLDGGITCFNDMYFFPEATAAAARDCGLRAVLGMVVVDFPTAYATEPASYLAKGLALRDQYMDDPRVSFALAPHAPYSVGDASFERIATLAAELDLPIHIHVHETESEIGESLARHGCRPLTRLHRLGIIGPQTIAVHGVHFEPAELDLLATQGVSLAHCPISNLKLASGIADIAGLVKRGIPIALGTDGAASNNRLDLWQEMRFAALLAKGRSGNAGLLGAHAALHAATLGGARALGLDARLGSLEAGKAADICAVRLDDWRDQPCFDPASHLVYVTGRENVSDVWVAGECRKYAGRLVETQLSGLIAEVKLWHTRLKSGH